MNPDPSTKPATPTKLWFFAELAWHFDLSEDAWLQVRAIAKRVELSADRSIRCRECISLSAWSLIIPQREPGGMTQESQRREYGVTIDEGCNVAHIVVSTRKAVLTHLHQRGTIHSLDERIETTRKSLVAET